MDIRPATFDDTPSLTFLRQERAVLLQQSDMRLKAPMLAFEAALADEHCRLLVGEFDNRIVGYVMGFEECSPLGALPIGIGYIAELTLDAHQYHSGLGRLLTGALRKQMPGVQQFMVHVPRYHAVEQAFWRAMGAKEDPQPIFARSPALVWMIL